MYGMIPWVAGRVGVGRQAGMLAGLAGAVIPERSESGQDLIAICPGQELAALLAGDFPHLDGLLLQKCQG